MKTLCFLLAFLAFTGIVAAQTEADTIRQQVNAFSNKISPDSLAQKIQLPDSLLTPYRRVDSIRNDFNAKAGSLKSEYDSSITVLDSQKLKLTSKIDSLEKLNLPTGKYTKRLDSLQTVQSSVKGKFDSKMAELKGKTTGKLDALDLPAQYKEPVSALTKNIDAVNLDQANVAIPGVEIPGYEMPQLEHLGDVDLKNIGSMPGLPKIETPIGDLGQVGQQLQGVGEDVKNITNGDLNNVQNISKTIEEQAGKIDGVAELQKQTGVMNEYQSQIENLSDADAAKKQAAEMAQKAAVNHFAGKEEQLKAAMDKMSKYKQKYSSVSSIKDLPKKRPNAMKGKPLVERIIPGLFFQYQQKVYNLFDFNPYVGYRLSGRFTTGLGWNQRFGYDRRTHDWNKRARIYGPRAFVDFRLGKGFIAHLETEVMNTFVPSVIAGSILDQGQREWVWGMMTGIKKDYKIYKNLRGTVLIQYNLFNPKYKAPYVDRLNSRIGFEYMLHKKKKQETSSR